MNPSDATLLEQWIARRDPEAMALIVSRYSAMVYATCKRVTRNATDAEDIAQECFLKLSSVQHSGTSLPGLLHTMATRLALNKARGDARRRAREAEYTALTNDATEASWNDIQPLIDEAIAALPEERSTVIIRHFLRGETHAEIAEDLGLTRAAISKRVARGVEEVREALRRRGVIASVASLSAMLAEASAEAMPAGLAASLGRLAVSGAGQRAAVVGSTNLAWAKAAAALVVIAASIGVVALRAHKVVPPPAPALVSNAAGSESTEHAATSSPANEKQNQTGIDPKSLHDGQDGVVSGVLRSALGTPRAKAQLVKTRIGTNSSSVTSDESGHFEIPRAEAPGTWVSMDDSLEASAILTIPPTPGPESLTIDLSAGVAEVFGRVTGPDGNSIADTEIEFEIANESGVAHLLSGWAHTNTQGYYTTYLPAADEYSLRVRVAAQQDETLNAWNTPLALSNDIYYVEIPELSITSEAATRVASHRGSSQAAEPLHSFGGSIVDTEGKPIADAHLFLYAETPCLAKTDAQGHWQRLLPESTDSLGLDVWHPDFIPSRLSPQHNNPSQARMRDGSSVLVMERGTAINGVVRDRSGRPAADVLIKLGLGGSVRSGADGHFTTPCLPPGQWPVALVHPDYAVTSATLEVPSKNPVVALVLDEGGTIAGRVVSSAGKPLSGVRVRANELFQENAIPTNLGIEATTGESGEFRLDRVPSAGQVRVTVEAEKDSSETMPFLSISTFALTPRQEPYEITLYPPPHVQGQVLDEKTGEPVTAFTVENRSVMTAPVGGARFITKFPENTVSIANDEGRFTQLITDGYVDLTPNEELFVDVTSPGYLPASSPTIHVGDTLEPLVIRLQRAEHVRGTILSLSGAPKRGVQVAWANSDHRIMIGQGKLRAIPEERGFATTDDVGHFEFELGGDEGELIAVCDEGYATVAMESFTPGSSLKLLAWANVRGVYYRGGLPCPEVLIDMRDSVTGQSESRSALLWVGRDTTHTDGSFSFDFLPSLPLEVGASVFVQGHQNVWPGAVVEPKPGESVIMELGREPGNAAGKIALPDGEEWSAANIRIVVTPTSSDTEGVSLPEIATKVEENGTFQIENLAPGNYTLMASVHDVGPDSWTGLGESIAGGTAKFSISPDEANTVLLPEILLHATQGTGSDPRPR